MRLGGEGGRSMKRGGSLFEIGAVCLWRVACIYIGGNDIDLCYGLSAVLRSGFRAIEFGMKEVEGAGAVSYAGRVVGSC
jgi:hypothetical protein